MKDFPLSGEDSLPNSPIRKILEGAIGKALVLSEAPTSSTNTVPEKELGYFNNKLYITIEGVLKEFSLSNTA